VPLTAQILIIIKLRWSNASCLLISLTALKGEILIFKTNNIPICKRNEVTGMNVTHASMPVLSHLTAGCSRCIVAIVQVLKTVFFSTSNN